MASSERVVTIFGSTGVTRDKFSQKAQALVPLGVELAQADLHDEASLQGAIAGSYAVFAVTDYWLPDIGEKEYDMSILLAKISHKAGVQVFIWASLPDFDRLSGGKYPAPQFSGKAKAWEVIKKVGLPYTATVEAPIYYQNMGSAHFNKGPMMFGFSRNDDGSADLHLPLGPDNKAPWFDVNDIGAPTLAVLKAPERYNGKRIVFSSPVFNQPGSALATTFTRVTGVPAKVKGKSAEELAAFNKEFAEVFTFIKENSYFVGEPDEIDATEVTDVPFSSFETWLRQSSIPAHFK